MSDGSWVIAAGALGSIAVVAAAAPIGIWAPTARWARAVLWALLLLSTPLLYYGLLYFLWGGIMTLNLRMTLFGIVALAPGAVIIWALVRISNRAASQ